MLKKPASFVLASFRPSTYPEGTPQFLTCCGLAGWLFEHPEKKRPALVWNTKAAIRTGWRSAILQSLKADCPALPSSPTLHLRSRAYWHRASIARPLNHHPATEAVAAPFARWLHKSGSNSNAAADLSKLCPPPSLFI